ncbi:MAG: ferritin-like domain-containing protein [Burkholderiales bacterium]
MMLAEISPSPIIDINDLGLDRGAHLLIKRALRDVPVAAKLGVRGTAPDLNVHLMGWCRAQGHQLEFANNGTAWITRGDAQAGRWRDSEQAGGSDANASGAVADFPKAAWGLAARGATVEAGAPEFHFTFAAKETIWANEAAHIYAQAVAAQWNPDEAIDWSATVELPEEIEDAVVQVMTFLIENENAALLVPARFLGQVHPHFREVLQVLAIQIADEARHVEVFTRRAVLKSKRLGLSTAGGQASLKTLFEESEFAIASFLLSVLGEGTFVSLLHFLHLHAPDPVTRQIAKLTARDEARHVAFGMAHLQYQLKNDSGLRSRLAMAIENRFESLSQTAGLNEEVFDALVLLAAGQWSPEAIAQGYAKVQTLKEDMAEGRQLRLHRLGFDSSESNRLASLHTRNFM